MNICRHPVRGCDAEGMLNAWLWPRLIPEICARDDGAVLLGAGGLIDRAMPALTAHRRVVVFGAGARGTADLPPMTDAWDIRFVRGPDTARALGLSPERWLCDPAALAPKLVGGRDRSLRARPRRIGLIPGRHISGTATAALAEGAGLHPINTAEGAESLIAEIFTCDAVICGDPVAAVIADAAGVPWRPLHSAAADEGDAFEWLDLSRSLGLAPCAVDIPHLARPETLVAETAMRVAIRNLRNAARCDRWSLSDRTLLRLRQQALEEEIADLRAYENSPRRNLRLVVNAGAAIAPKPVAAPAQAPEAQSPPPRCWARRVHPTAS